MSCKFWELGPLFGRTGVRSGLAMVPLDRALVSSYRLSVVTMPLTEAVWPQFAMQVLVGGQYPRLGDGDRKAVRIGTAG